MKCFMQRLFIIILLAFIAGCSSYPAGYSSSVFVGSSWYYDYYDYWMYDDHHCCHDPDDFEDSVKDWWHTLDQDEKDDIRDDLNAWLDGEDPNFDAMQDALRRKWDTMPADKQQEIIQKGQQLKDSSTIMPVVGKGVTASEVKDKAQNLSPEQKQAAQEKLNNVDRAQVKQNIESMPVEQKTQIKTKASQVQQQRTNIRTAPRVNRSTRPSISRPSGGRLHR